MVAEILRVVLQASKDNKHRLEYRMLIGDGNDCANALHFSETINPQKTEEKSMLVQYQDLVAYWGQLGTKDVAIRIHVMRMVRKPTSNNGFSACWLVSDVWRRERHPVTC